MAFDTEFLKTQKEALLQIKARLEADLARFATRDAGQRDFETKMEDLGDGEDERMLEVEDYVDNLGVEATLEKELADVVAALAKIEAGTYGICEKTGKEIALERLRVYPAARVAL